MDTLADSDLREEIRRVMRLAHEWGILGGARSGNASVRTHEDADGWWLVTPSGGIKPLLRESEILTTSSAGRSGVTEDWSLHVALYRAFPAAQAVLHCHLPYATALLAGIGDGSVLWADSVSDLIELLLDMTAQRSIVAVRGHGFWHIAETLTDALADLDMIEATAWVRWLLGERV